ncbi:MAG: hypothetical protein ABI851_01000 [Saprospiraceae bacterium]
MPYRYFLVPAVFITIVYLCYIFYFDFEPNAFILIGLVGLTVSIFVFQHQINKFWWTKSSPPFEEKDKSWVNRYLNYVPAQNGIDLEWFYPELARFTALQEYILLGNAKAHEELKWMSVGPAIIMKLFRTPEIYDHYTRIAYYPHPFISPQMEYVHVSESHPDDGMLIFSIEQLIQAHLDSYKYFNPALYEWSKIFSNKFLVQYKSNLVEIVKILESKVHGSSYEEILVWMGQKELDNNALVCYIYFTNKELIKSDFPEIYAAIENQII